MHDPSPLEQRRTIRAFGTQPVTPELIRAILQDAHQAPSSSNQQPWHFHVLTDSARQRLVEAIAAARAADQRPYDPSRGRGRPIPKQFVDRTRSLFRGLRPVISQLGDQKKDFIEGGSCRFYDAPVVILLSMHRDLPVSRLLDIGMAAQNIMLSAQLRGLGTCAIGLILAYEEIVAEAINLPEHQRLQLAIALGYPAADSGINAFRATRAPLEECLTWVD